MALSSVLLLAACQNADVQSDVGQQALMTSVRPAATAVSIAQRFPAARNCADIGVLLPDVLNVSRWELRDRPNLEQAIKAQLPNATVTFSNAQGDPDRQLEQASEQLQRGACILVVVAQDAVKASTIVQIAAQRGVPVIAYERMIDNIDVAFYVSVDNVRAGELQGEWIASNVTKGVKLAMINGPQNDHSGRALQGAVMSKLRPLIERGDLSLAYELNAPNWSIKNATSSAVQLFDPASQNRDVSVIYAATDDMANGIIAVLQQKSMAGKVIVIGQDASPEGVRNILSGFQSMTIHRKPAALARNTAMLVGMLSRGEDADSAANVLVGLPSGASVRALLETPVVVDRGNAQSILSDDGKVSSVDVCALDTVVKPAWCP
jgi:D-xylose transport system substrate-binding protein